MPVPRAPVAVAVAALVGALTGTLTTAVPAASAPSLAPAAPAAPASWWFDRVATYPVFQNVPDGVDPAAPTLAEISAVSEDGRTVVYTDAEGRRVGFLDISDPAAPVGAGTVDLAALGDAQDSPTSVEVVGGHVLVVVDSSGGDFASPSGRLDVLRLSDRERVASIDLGGQPDSIDVSPDGQYAAIAMENQRDEEVTPPGGEEGDLPQAPAGFVQVIRLDGTPGTWTAEPVALDAAALDGLDTPTDAEPEYVDIDDDNRLVVTLQENNGLAVVDLAAGEVVTAFSAGEATVDGVDTDNDGVFDFSDSLTAPREPDAAQWVGGDLVATANEGDWKGGTRGWTVFDTTTGEVVWDAGNTFENLAVSHGLFNDDRADNKGSEPEGLAFAEMGGTPYAFVGSERSNFVAVYDMSDPTEPAFRQVLPTTNGPEGLLPVPSRNLFVVSSEEDDAEALVRATVGVYRLGGRRPSFPSIVSVPGLGQQMPIGWGALGALSGVPGRPDRLWAASDAAYATGRLYSVDVSRAPAVIDRVVEVTDRGTAPELDIEGVAARRGGGFWLAHEGATGPANALLRTDAAGAVRQRVELPSAVTSGLRQWGLEGVAVHGTGSAETVYVVLQRAIAGETAARIGRYRPSTGQWAWWGYPLATTSRPGDWIGLSEVTAVDDDTLALVERDKQNGTTAALKRVYTVDLDRPAAATGTPPVLRKRLAVDLLPALRAPRGWVQEKVEGLGITSGGRVFAVTDNDGLDDATGETQLLSLGALKKVFAAGVRTRTRLSVADRTVRQGQKVRVDVRVEPRFADGRVRLYVDRRLRRSVALEDGRARVRLPLGPGRHEVRAFFTGDADAAGSTSRVVRVRVLPRR